MLESLTVNQIIEMGFPYFLVLVSARVLNRLWQDLWPWIKEYMGAHELRWEKQFNANQEREAMMQQQSREFLLALGSFQNGFAESNAKQHKELLNAVKAVVKQVNAVVESLTQYRTANISMIELLATRIDDQGADV